MKMNTYLKLVEKYNIEMANKAIEWFNGSSSTFKYSLTDQFKYIVDNEYLWNV